jgi:hypothetical protein
MTPKTCGVLVQYVCSKIGYYKATHLHCQLGKYCHLHNRSQGQQTIFLVKLHRKVFPTLTCGEMSLPLTSICSWYLKLPYTRIEGMLPWHRCVCVCVCVSYTYTHIYTHINICIEVRDSSVGIAGIEYRWGRHFPYPFRSALGPTRPPIQWVFPVIKQLGVALNTDPHK